MACAEWPAASTPGPGDHGRMEKVICPAPPALGNAIKAQICHVSDSAWNALCIGSDEPRQHCRNRNWQPSLRGTGRAVPGVRTPPADEATFTVEVAGPGDEHVDGLALRRPPMLGRSEPERHRGGSLNDVGTGAGRLGGSAVSATAPHRRWRGAGRPDGLGGGAAGNGEGEIRGESGGGGSARRGRHLAGGHAWVAGRRVGLPVTRTYIGDFRRLCRRR
jgi:hypothetical protein